MNENIDLTKILKDCPERWNFWSPLLGNVKLNCVCKDGVIVRTVEHTSWKLNQDGTVKIGTSTSPEIMLYPSKEQRNWSKFTAPWYKKERFDPKTLKPFDKVLVRDSMLINNSSSCLWGCQIFSFIREDEDYPYVCINDEYSFCIPYNDKTKHLVGTNKEAPEYYRYWED